jgi:hypothetical protein
MKFSLNVIFSVFWPLSRLSKKNAFALNLSTGITNTKSVLSFLDLPRVGFI